MTKTIQITEEEWEERYKPLEQLLDVYGEDWERVKSFQPYNVWTLYEGDWGLYIFNGIHFVNRLGYYICEEKWTEGELIEVYIKGDDIYD